MKFYRFLPLLSPLAIFVITEIFYFWPKTLYYSVLAVLTVIFYTTYVFAKLGINKEKWWKIFILPAYFFIGLAAFITIVPNKILVQIFLFINLFYQYFYYRIVYNFLIRTESYQDFSLENISAYGNFLAIYFISSSIFGLQSFLNMPIWLTMLALIFITALVIYQVLWANKIAFVNSSFYIVIACFILIEIAWSASFLPLSFYVMGLLFSIFYYILVGLTRFHLLNKLDKSIVKLYLIYGLSSILAVLLTARWI